MASPSEANSVDGNDKKVCVPCSTLDPSAVLGKSQIQWKLQQLPLWTLQNGSHMFLSRQFTTKNFQAALDCINAMGAIAEREGHHPNFHLTSYRDIQVDIWTHKLNGLTENDFVLAEMLNREIKIEYSPKWLREHPEAEFTATSKH